MEESIEELKETKDPLEFNSNLNDLINIMNDSSKKSLTNSCKINLKNSYLKTPFIINNDIFTLHKDKGK